MNRPKDSKDPNGDSGPPEDPRTQAIEAALRRRLRGPLTLTVTDNRRSMISVRWRDRECRIRLHHMFLEADDGVLGSLADFFRGKARKVRERLDSFIRDHENAIRRPPPSPGKRKTVIRPRGVHFHLRDVFERLNSRYFQGRADCAVTWGARRKRRGQKSVRLGSYCRRSNIIRINPLLDRAFVPSYVIDDVVYHEMLHHLLGVETRNGRTICHHAHFRRMEREFAHRTEAALWIRHNLNRLLGP